MSGHLGRAGGRQVVAVLALGGGLLLGPALSAQAHEDHAAGPADTGGPAPTAPDTAQGLDTARGLGGAHALVPVPPPGRDDRHDGRHRSGLAGAARERTAAPGPGRGGPQLRGAG
ncbi:hypothetical protein [Streptomyces sp. NPDC004065]|uniref:hypothetical protein n=1 Tax=Streptomyces sp. NPDC004065 TaxID=3364689 RepID=UPI00384A6F29